MSQPNAQEIIEKARTDSAVYTEMVAKENAFWGGILPSLERDQAAAADREASIKLEIHTRLSSFMQQARLRNLHFTNGLTLGCGAGRLEREIMRRGFCDRMHGIDISDEAVAEARRQAEALGYALTYTTGDMNRIELPEAEYDLVVTQTSLHHVLELEHVADEIRKTLKSGGYLWIHDFVGETQAQYDPRRLEVLNGLLAVLPEKLRRNTITKRTLTEVKSAVPGRLSSPFEQIRSGEIVGIFKQRFDVEWSLEFNTILDLLVPPGQRAAYAENEDSQALFKTLTFFDEFLHKHGILTPRGGQYLMRPKAQSPRSDSQFGCSAASDRLKCHDE